MLEGLGRCAFFVKGHLCGSIGHTFWRGRGPFYWSSFPMLEGFLFGGAGPLARAGHPCSSRWWGYSPSILSTWLFRICPWYSMAGTGHTGNKCFPLQLSVIREVYSDGKPSPTIMVLSNVCFGCKWEDTATSGVGWCLSITSKGPVIIFFRCFGGGEVGKQRGCWLPYQGGTLADVEFSDKVVGEFLGQWFRWENIG